MKFRTYNNNNQIRRVTTSETSPTLRQNEIPSRSSHFADGRKIVDLEETATVTGQKSRQVLTVKGVKQVNKIKKGTLVTTCCIINA